MQGLSDAFAANLTSPAPDRREMVAEHLERLAGLVREHGVADGDLTTGPHTVGQPDPPRMEYKVRLVIERPDRVRPVDDLPVWEFDGE